MKIIYKDGHVDECPQDQELHVIRHTAAHVMAQAIKRLYPEADFAFGPATENGFYYDVDLGDTKLTDEDLKSDSPYNLYTKEGLPPGPICNPGYASLYAASHPESHDYYYYVAMPDGSHLFASSYEEHQRNIATSNAAQAQAASKNTDQSTEVSGE